MFPDITSIIGVSPKLSSILLQSLELEPFITYFYSTPWSWNRLSLIFTPIPGVESDWMVDLQRKRILVYRYTDDTVLYTYSFTDQIPVGIWNNECIIDFGLISEHLGSMLDAAE